MKILILTVTAGEGHNSMAKCIAEKLVQENHEVKIIDIFKKYGKPGKTSFINDGYINACKYALPLYNFIFRNWQLISTDKRNQSIAQTWLEHETPQLINDIYSFKPDIILGTHFYSGIMLTNLKRKFNIPAKVISLLTDYTVHPFHECATKIDYLITPTKELHPQLIKRGYKESQLIPLGIPTKQVFNSVIQQSDAQKELGISQDLFTVLISVGGSGFGGSVKILKKLLKVSTPLQIIIVNGHNKQAYEKIEVIKEQNETNHKIVNFGFTDKISTIMSACDCIVGKCGATMLNEALNKGKPLILSSNLAQQEYDNMLYLSSHGACIRISKDFPLEQIIEHISLNPQILDMIKLNINKIKKPTALDDICTFITSFNCVKYPSDTKVLSSSEIKSLKHELKKLSEEETLSIKRENKEKRKITTLTKGKKYVHQDKKEKLLEKEVFNSQVKKTKSVIYTNEIVDETPSLLGINSLKKQKNG